MKHITLEELLVDIRRRSDRLNRLQPEPLAENDFRIRVEQINGMLELVELLGYADFSIPAILYGFLQSEAERLKNSSD